jgi:hypothetical protein
MKPIIRAVVVAAAAMMLAACGGDESTPVDPAVEAATVGKYTLTAIEAGPLPYEYHKSDTSRFEIISGSLELTADHDLTDILVTNESRLSDGAQIGAEAVSRYLGTWRIRGDSIRLSYPGLGVQMAARSGQTIELVSDGLTLRYTK